MLGRAVAMLVRAYQVTLSRVLPAGSCRFHPTCSEYAIQSLRANGLIRGGRQALWRILRCQPWGRPGIDEVRVRARG